MFQSWKIQKEKRLRYIWVGKCPDAADAAPSRPGQANDSVILIKQRQRRGPAQEFMASQLTSCKNSYSTKSASKVGISDDVRCI